MTAPADNGYGGFSSVPMFTIPNVPNGLYWILWEVDGTSVLPELDDGDNRVHSPVTPNIQC
jgi:hypothetical protein